MIKKIFLFQFEDIFIKLWQFIFNDSIILSILLSSMKEDWNKYKILEDYKILYDLDDNKKLCFDQFSTRLVSSENNFIFELIKDRYLCIVSCIDNKT